MTVDLLLTTSTGVFKQNKQLVLDRDLDEWLEITTMLPGLHLAELACKILVDSCRLPEPFKEILPIKSSLQRLVTKPLS